MNFKQCGTSEAVMTPTHSSICLRCLDTGKTSPPTVLSGGIRIGSSLVLWFSADLIFHRNLNLIWNSSTLTLTTVFFLQMKKGHKSEVCEVVLAWWDDSDNRFAPPTICWSGAVCSLERFMRSLQEKHSEKPWVSTYLLMFLRHLKELYLTLSITSPSGLQSGMCVGVPKGKLSRFYTDTFSWLLQHGA